MPEKESFVPSALPDKKYFKIREVARLAKLPEYTLRYWETEFKQLCPKKSPKGHRLYQRSDLELIFKIKHLLYEKKYTIDGAREELSKPSASSQNPELKKEQQLGFGFEQNLLKDKLKKALKELREIEQQLRSSLD